MVSAQDRPFHVGRELIDELIGPGEREPQRRQATFGAHTSSQGNPWSILGVLLEKCGLEIARLTGRSAVVGDAKMILAREVSR